MKTKPTRESKLCMHGYVLTDCLTCHKEPGQCDWGACESRNVQPYKRTVDGRHVETRSLCGDHIRLSLQLDGYVYSDNSRNPACKTHS